MRVEFLLTHRYIKQHLRQCIGVFFCVALLATAIFSTLLLRDSFAETNRRLWDELKGLYSATIYQADPQRVIDEKENLQQSGSGIATITHVIHVEGMNEEEIPYIGTLDKNTMEMRAIKLRQGRLPEKQNEIAIEQSTYDKLKLESNIGDSIVLEFMNPDGKVEESTYVLVGILSDYVNSWKVSDQSLLIANGVTEIIRIPGIITIEQEQEPILYVNISCSEFYNLDINGIFVPNIQYQQSNPGQDQENLNLNLISSLFLIFLTLVIVLGIYGIVALTLKERKKYVGMMRCIGLTKKQTFCLFLLQGFYLSIFSVAGSILFGLCGIYVAKAVMDAINQTFVIHITFFPFIVTFGIVFFAVLVIFLIQTARLLQGAPLQYHSIHRKKVRTTRFSWNFSWLWSRATSKIYRTQNMLSITLVCGCTLVLLLGSFAAVFIPRAMYQGELTFYNGADYVLSLSTASSDLETFHVLFPRNVGISKENIEVLNHTKGLEVCFSGVTVQSRQLALVPKDTQNLFLIQQKEERPIQNSQSDFVLQQIGAKTGDTLAEIPVIGVDINQIEKLKPYIVEGEIHIDQFKAGKEIVVEEDYYNVIGKDYFQVGDEITIVTPILPDGSTRDRINGEVGIKTYPVRISAILSGQKRGYEYASLYPFDGKLIMFSDLMLESDPTVKYDRVTARISSDEIDPQIFDNIRKTIYQVAAQSNGIQVTDLPKYRENLKQEISNRGMMIGLCVIVFLIIITAAFCLMTFIKVKTNLHSYIILRALGLDIKQMRKVVIFENVKQVSLGLIIGGLFGFGICIYSACETFFIQTWDIITLLIIPEFLIIGIILIGISILACIIPIKKVKNINITEKLEDIEY